MFKVIFTDANGEHCAEWTSFPSTAEARSAIRDADLIIPFTWTYEILPA